LKSDVDETWVSTDDLQIKSIAKMAGSKVIDRPLELSTDTSQSEEALIHFSKNIQFDLLVFLQPTSPLIEHTDINKALLMMDEYDSVFSAYKEHWLPRWDQNVDPVDWTLSNRPRRQDIESRYVENGGFYITKKSNLIKSGLRYSGKIGIYEMPFSRSFQIDTEDDILIIESQIGK
tara:strand:- start:5111 stop:5638 length:528 start_codon:yes stop_codon:yes gene_type:complete